MLRPRRLSLHLRSNSLRHPGGGTSQAVSTGQGAGEATPSSVSTRGPGNGSPKEDNTSSSEAAVNVIDAIGTQLSRILTAISWALVTLIILWTFRKGFQAEVPKLLESVRTALEGGGVTLDIGTVVKLQVSERPPDISLDQTRLFSRSPFEIDPNPAAERHSPLVEIAPQIEFAVSDYVAGIWATAHDTERRLMEQARETVRNACVNSFWDNAAALLGDYARKLEAVRFLQAQELAAILDQHHIVRNWVEGIQPGNQGDERQILHATGVAYAQLGQWQRARKLLDKIAAGQQNPRYLPAADAWLASVYHDELERLRNTEPDATLASSTAFVNKTEDLSPRALR
jgi:hypothetical protein